MILINKGRTGQPGRYKVDYGMGYFYSEYLKQPSAEPLTQKQFTDIWKQYINKIMFMVIKDKYDFRLQAQLGRIYIVSKKMDFRFSENGNMIRKGISVDWPSTVKMWNEDPETYRTKRVVYFFNEHSGRRKFRFYWDKRRCGVKNQSYYLFYPSRKWKRELAKWIKDDDFDTIYYEAK